MQICFPKHKQWSVVNWKSPTLLCFFSMAMDTQTSWPKYCIRCHNLLFILQFSLCIWVVSQNVCWSSDCRLRWIFQRLWAGIIDWVRCTEAVLWRLR